MNAATDAVEECDAQLALQCADLPGGRGLQIAAAIGGGLAPIVAASLLQAFGSLVPIGVYLAGLGIVAAICALLAWTPSTIGQAGP